MITVEKALGIILSNLPERKIEQVPFQASLGRVLAEDLTATCDIPPFDRSAMDGYAVAASDAEHAPVELEIAGEIRAGGGLPQTLPPGKAMSIMTGAPVPRPADAVQVVEECRLSEDGRRVTINKPVHAGDNIAPRGSEATSGEVVLRAGHRIGPAEIAVMATFGYSRVRVWKVPEIAVFATGDELVEVDQTPRPDQIRNSNAYCIIAQLQYMGLRSEYLGIVRDDKDELRQRMLEGLRKDVLIISGGVSMGEYDYVKDIFEELGLEILFSRVAIKPGKPTVFARKGDTLVFGLPGNPISALVTFECFVRPALGNLCGMAQSELHRMKGELLEDMEQNSGRMAFFPAWVYWEEGGLKVDPLPWKSSADIIGFAGANATYIFPRGKPRMRKGETVEVMLLPDFFLRQR